MVKGKITKHTHKTKDRVTGTPLKAGDELRCSGSVGSSCAVLPKYFAFKLFGFHSFNIESI
jgi:hypothetical protein